MEIIIFLLKILQCTIPLFVIGLAWYMLIAKQTLNQEKQLEKIESKIKPGVFISLDKDQKAIVLLCMKFTIIVEDEEGRHKEIYKQHVKNVFD